MNIQTQQKYNRCQIWLVRLMAAKRHISFDVAFGCWISEGHAATWAQEWSKEQ